jgi:retron-type reverse transcriptase
LKCSPARIWAKTTLCAYKINTAEPDETFCPTKRPCPWLIITLKPASYTLPSIWVSAAPNRLSAKWSLTWGAKPAGTGVRAREYATAWKRVKANRGAAGVDGLNISQTVEHLRWAWPDLQQQLLEGTYRPQPVRRVSIPKPNGSERELGIPNVTDRLIQQTLLHVLQPLIDPTFCEHSHGFRPGRRAHDAVLSAQRYVQQGRHIVVDVDLSKFFDRVNHDILIDRLRKRVNDPGLIRLAHAYLNAGIMDGGVVTWRVNGTPQGGSYRRCWPTCCWMK